MNFFVVMCYKLRNKRVRITFPEKHCVDPANPRKTLVIKGAFLDDTFITGDPIPIFNLSVNLAQV